MEYTFKLQESEVNFLLHAASALQLNLQESNFRGQVIQKLQEQAQSQMEKGSSETRTKTKA